MIVAVAALVLSVSVFVPWFKATVRVRGSAVSGFLIEPKGTLSGIAVHGYLWVAFALALLQFMVLAVRHVPARRTVTLPGSRQLVALAAGLSCVAVLTAVVMKPATWQGGNELGEGFYIVVGWTYGAVVALAAAIVSLCRRRGHPGGSAHRLSVTGPRPAARA